MSQPRILVMTAAGKTGLPIAAQLLSEGFPVTAFVRQADARSEQLTAQGADIVVGSITDLSDMRRAMSGAQRAYFCTPPAIGNLKAAAIFTAVAAEQLASVVAMSQWLSQPNYPALHTRDVWLADRLLALLPNTDVTFINPGFFADNDLQVLSFVAQFGLLTLPYGAGRNAPPSNDDMARVAAEILARPAGHAGKTYRPTGPQLLTPQDIAATYAKVLGHKVTYRHMPISIMAKVMQGMGVPPYAIAMYHEYAVDYQQNAFAINAPTDVVRTITGREPEDFETIVRHYVAPFPDAQRRLVTQGKLLLLMLRSLLRRGPRIAPSLGLDEFSDPQHAIFSAHSSEWHQQHDPQTMDRPAVEPSPIPHALMSE